MEYLSTKYGLVTDEDKTTENGQLFLVELMLLQMAKNDPGVIESIRVMHEQLQNSSTGISGLYHRNPDLTDRRIMSHDNMSAIMTYSYLLNTSQRFEIWNYLLKHLGTYDNSQGVTKQLSRFLPFNPANFLIWGLCAKSKIYLIFLPFYMANLWLSCRTPAEDSDGKILNWLELTPHKDHWLMKHFHRYFEKKMKAQYGEDYLTPLLMKFHGGNSSEFPIKKILGVL